MAKRNANDRNEVALRARRAKNETNTWTALDGRVIKLKKPDLMFIQAAINSVEFPDRPTYEVKVGARTQHFPIDADVIKQTTDPVEKKQLRDKWVAYLTDLNNAAQLQSRRGTGATFYEGTIPDDEMVEGDTRWAKKMKVTGWALPDDAEERWVFYLQTSLSEDEMTDLGSAVVRMAGGVSEELISAAEEMFRDDLSTGSGPDDLADLETDQGTDS